MHHIDRAWASTVHALKGRTVDTVIAAMEANHLHLSTHKTFCRSASLKFPDPTEGPCCWNSIREPVGIHDFALFLLVCLAAPHQDMVAWNSRLLVDHDAVQRGQTVQPAIFSNDAQWNPQSDSCLRIHLHPVRKFTVGDERVISVGEVAGTDLAIDIPP